MTLDLHRIANYLRLQTDDEAKALYEMLASNLGLDVTAEEFKVKAVYFLAEETRISTLKAVQQQEQALELIKQIKEEILTMAKLMHISSEERSKFAVVLQQIQKRILKSIFGIDPAKYN